MQTPDIFFNNKKECLNKITTLFVSIIDIVSHVVNKEYEYMSSYGIAPNQIVEIYNIVNSELDIFTNKQNREWCDNTTLYIMAYMKNSLYHMTKVKPICEIYTSEELSKIIYNTIISCLQFHSEGRLYTKCNVCSKNVQIDPSLIDEIDKNTCDDCIHI